MAAAQSEIIAPETIFFKVPPEIDVRIFQSLSSINDAENFSQVSHRFYDIWCGHSKFIVQALIHNNIECTPEACRLATYQTTLRSDRSTPHLTTINFGKRVFSNDTLAQVAVVQFSSEMFCKYRKKEGGIPLPYSFTQEERQRFIGALYRALFIATILFKYSEEEHELSMKMPKYIARWTAKEFEEAFTLLWWVEGLQSRSLLPENQIVKFILESFQGYGMYPLDRLLVGFHKAHYQAITGAVIGTLELCDPDRFLTLDTMFKEKESPKGRLVAETFKQIASTSDGGSGEWWQVPGIWDKYASGH